MNERILIIDDDPNLCSTLAAIFKRRGYRVSTALTGAAALDLIAAQPYELAFLDLRLPDMDGLALLPRLIEAAPGLPVLILTALVSVEQATRAIGLGARGYLLKPVTPEIVITRAESLLIERRSTRLNNEIRNELHGLYDHLPGGLY